MTFSDRVCVGEGLRRNESFRAIANYLHKSPTTISREVKSHSQTIKAKGNNCIHRSECNKKSLCGKPGCTTRSCKNCKIPCHIHCSEYVKAHCDKLLQPPYVCNACKSAPYCSYEKKIYNPKFAEKEYRDALVDKRNGFDLTEDEIDRIDEMVSPLIMNGLSPYHIKQTYGDELPICEATLRKLIAQCKLTARNINLRDQVKRRPRRKSVPKLHNESLSAAKIGHRYEDYLHYMSLHETHTVQLAFIMDCHTSSCVVKTLDKTEEALGSELFKKAFPVILTDNGHEFTDIAGMERFIMILRLR